MTMSYFYRDRLTLAILANIESGMSLEEWKELDEKTREIIGSIGNFRDIDSRIVAERAFLLGYLSAQSKKIIGELKCVDHEGDNCPCIY